MSGQETPQAVAATEAGDLAATEAGEVAAPARADARRNRLAILRAAEAAFAEEGLGVPVDEIARRAGVGAGTLYRNFPTKEALFEAVIRHHMEALATQARELSSSDHPGPALFQFLGHLAEQASLKRNLVDALSGAGVDLKVTLAGVKQEVDAAAEVLLQRAQQAGEVRQDVALPDLFALVMGACRFSGAHPDTGSQSRMIAVVCDGLRA
jgi:AcrR family transcriptional regulator